MWKIFFILPIYPICEKKFFISLILRCYVENRAQNTHEVKKMKKSVAFNVNIM